LDALRELHAEEPAFAQALARVLARRVRALHGEMAETCALPARQRLALRLLRLAARWGRWREGALGLPFRLSQADLGQMLGLSRQQVNLELRGFVEGGWVDVGRESIRLLDPDALRRTLDAGLPGVVSLVFPPRPPSTEPTAEPARPA
jgi:CRP-like cAMP-binding protein